MEKKDNWKIGFLIVFGVLIVTFFYLCYIIGLQQEEIDLKEESTRKFCDFSNQAIDLINSQTELLGYYSDNVEYKEIDKFDCYLY